MPKLKLIKPPETHPDHDANLPRPAEHPRKHRLIDVKCYDDTDKTIDIDEKNNAENGVNDTDMDNAAADDDDAHNVDGNYVDEEDPPDDTVGENDAKIEIICDDTENCEDNDNDSADNDGTSIEDDEENDGSYNTDDNINYDKKEVDQPENQNDDKRAVREGDTQRKEEIVNPNFDGDADPSPPQNMDEQMSENNEYISPPRKKERKGKIKGVTAQKTDAPSKNERPSKYKESNSGKIPRGFRMNKKSQIPRKLRGDIRKFAPGKKREAVGNSGHTPPNRNLTSSQSSKLRRKPKKKIWRLTLKLLDEPMKKKKNL